MENKEHDRLNEKTTLVYRMWNGLENPRQMLAVFVAYYLLALAVIIPVISAYLVGNGLEVFIDGNKIQLSYQILIIAFLISLITIFMAISCWRSVGYGYGYKFVIIIITIDYFISLVDKFKHAIGL